MKVIKTHEWEVFCSEDRKLSEKVGKAINCIRQCENRYHGWGTRDFFKEDNGKLFLVFWKHYVVSNDKTKQNKTLNLLTGMWIKQLQ